jgi:hypothetical protein
MGGAGPALSGNLTVVLARSLRIGALLDHVPDQTSIKLLLNTCLLSQINGINRRSH